MLPLVGTCCVHFETGQTFGPTSPNISIVCDGRSVAQQCCSRLHGAATMLANAGLVKTSAHAPCNIFFQKTNNRSAFSSFWIVVNMVYQTKLSE